MTFSSISLAREAIATLFKTAWDAQVGDIPVVVYDDFDTEIPGEDTPWVRFVIRHSIFEQATLANDVGSRRFRRFGIVAVQIYTPPGSGMTEPYKFAKVALDAFEGQSTSPDGVLFRNVRVNEEGQEGPWFKTSVFADFEYDEIK